MKPAPEHIRKFSAHDFLYVGFTCRTSRTNNERARHFLCPLRGVFWHSVDDLE